MCCSAFLAFLTFKNKKRNVHVLDHCAVQNFTFQLSFTIDAKLNCESSALSAHWVPAWSVSSRRNMNRKRGHDGQTEGQWRECLWAQSLIYKDGEFNNKKKSSYIDTNLFDIRRVSIYWNLRNGVRENIQEHFKIHNCSIYIKCNPNRYWNKT